MAHFSIISSQTGNVIYEGAPKYVGAYLKPGYLEFSEIGSPSPIDWNVGDYVVYSRTGRTYRLYSTPHTAEQATALKYGAAFLYENVQFFDDTKQLERCPFTDLVPQDNLIHFSTQNTVSFFGKPLNVAERIQACMEAQYGAGTWEIRIVSGLDPVGDAELIEILNTEVEFSVSGVNCLGVLDKVYETWNNLGWSFSVESGVNVITIGAPNKRTLANTTELYEYGDGLVRVQKSISNSDEIGTRLFAYGSLQNMPADYYRNQEIADAESIDIEHLMIPISSWGLKDGLPDARQAYVQDATAIQKLGLIPRYAYFDGSDPKYPDIHPSIEGLTIGDIYDANPSQYRPNLSKWSRSQRIDEVVSATNPDDHGTSAEQGQKYTETISGNLISQSEPFVEGDLISIEIFTTTLTKSGVLTLRFGQVPQAISLDTAWTPEFTLMLSVSATGNYKRFPVTVVQTGTQALTLTLPETVTIPGVSAGTVSVRIEGVVNKSDGDANGSQGTITISSSTPVDGGVEYELDKTFSIRIPQIGFDIEQYAALGDGKTISMKTGMCAARDFQIKDVRYVSSADAWDLTLYRSVDEDLSLTFPNADFPIEAGDKYVLLDIAMPEIYITAASQRLLQAAQELLADICYEKPLYEPEIDAKLVYNENRVLLDGLWMHVSFNGVDDYAIIDSITIDENGSNIPTYDVVLRKKKGVDWTESIGASSSSRSSKSVNSSEPVQAVGTVTSVGMSVPIGMTIEGSPITGAGIFRLGLASGYKIPLISELTNYFEQNSTLASLIQLKSNYTYLGPKGGLFFSGATLTGTPTPDLYVDTVNGQRVLRSPLPLITGGDQIVINGTPGQGGGGGGSSYLHDLLDVYGHESETVKQADGDPVADGDLLSFHRTLNAWVALPRTELLSAYYTSTQTNSAISAAIAALNLGTASTYNVGSVASGNTGLVTGGAVHSAINDAVASALKFQGTTTTAISDGSTTNPITVNGSSYTAKKGDVVLYDGKEYLWTGSAWEQLGDEVSWALKTTTISAGTGLTGGGSLAANRTISLSSATIASLALADSAYQKPSTGIPGTDLESGVQTSLGKADTALQSGDIKTLTLKMNKVGNTDVTIGSYTPTTAKTITISSQNIYDAIGTTKYAPYHSGGYVTINTAQTISGKKTFSHAEGIVIGSANIWWDSQKGALRIDQPLITEGDQIVIDGTPGGGGSGGGITLYDYDQVKAMTQDVALTAPTAWAMHQFYGDVFGSGSSTIASRLTAVENRATSVSVTQVVSSGTKIATITVDSVGTDLYAPSLPIASASVLGGVKVGSGLSIDASTGVLTATYSYTLPLAANGTRGGIQIGYTTSGKNYAVQLSSEKAYVNVPWTDTTYKLTLNGTTVKGTTGGTELGGFYAPTGGGSANQVLIAGGNNTAPSWTNQSNLSVGTASKLGSATVGSATMPIYLNAGTPTAITSFPEAYLSWGGKNLQDSYGPIDAAMISILGANRAAFARADGIGIFYSRDNGATWLDYGATNSAKSLLFTRGKNDSPFVIGKCSADDVADANCQLKVSIFTSAAGIYTCFNKVACYITTNGSTGCTLTIRGRLQSDYEADNDVWTTFVDSVPISGWSGWDIININETFGNFRGGVTTYGNTKNRQYGHIDFIFKCTGYNGNGSTQYGLIVRGIQIHGGMGWTTPSNMALNGHIYSWDGNQAAIFPNEIRPNSNNSYALGNNSYRWSGVYGVIANFTGNAIISGNTTIGGTLTVGSNIYMANARAIHIKDSGGTNRNILYYTASNVLQVGNDVGPAGHNTQILGNQITLHYGASKTVGITLASTGAVTIGGTLTLADSIKRSFTASNQNEAIKILGGNYDNYIWTVNDSNANANSIQYGYGLKYIGTGSGVSNLLRLMAGNVDGTPVTAIGVNQNGQVGILGDADTNYALKVNGAAYATSLKIGGATITWNATDGYLHIDKPLVTEGDQIVISGTPGGGGSGGATTLAQLDDVLLTSQSNGDLLQYNGSAWVNVAASTVGRIYSAGTGISISNANVIANTGVLSIGSKTGAITLGANLNISNGGELSATDTTYSNGTGIALNGTVFSLDVNGAKTALGLGTASTYAVASSVTQNDTTHLVTGAAVWTAIDNLPEPMVFKGSLGTNGTRQTLQVDGSASIGDTYKVITAGTYAGQTAKVGDTFICDSKTSSANTWVLIPSGDEPSGTVTSVAMTVPTGLSVTGSPITTSGTLAISFASGYSIPTTAKQGNWDTAYSTVTTSQTKNKVFASPSDASGAPSFRALVAADIPNLDWSKITSGKPTTLSGYGITDAQPLDADLTSIAGLTGTTGVLKKTAADTWALDTNIETYAGNGNTAYGYFSNGILPVGKGGTNKSSWTQYGVVYASASTTLAQVSNNTTSTRKFLRMKGTGSAAAAPAWDTVTKSDVGLGNVDNTADADKAVLSATKLTTVSKKIWGQTYWTSNGIPQDVTAAPNLYIGTTKVQTSSADQAVTGITTLTASGLIKTSNYVQATRFYLTDDIYFEYDSTNQYVRLNAPFVTSGDQIVISGTPGGGGGGGATTLAALDDVSLTSLASGNLLQYDGSAWVNVAATSVGKIYSAGTGISLGGTNSTVINHSNSVTAKTSYGSTATTASANGGTITVTDVKYDAQGHITASTDRTITLSQVDTKNTAGADNTTSKIFLVGPTAQTSSNGTARTYSNANCYASGGKLYSNAKEVVNLSDTQALTNKTYNGYTLAAACAKGVTDNSSNADVTSSDTNLITGRTLYYQLAKKGYTTNTGTVTKVSTGTGLTGGDITTSGTISINSTYQTYISNGNTAYGWGNHASAGYLTSVTLASGTNNGTLKLTVNGTATDNIAVKGLGSMAYETASNYVPTTRTVNSKALSSNITLTLDDIGNGSSRSLANYVLKAGDTMSGNLAVCITPNSVYPISRTRANFIIEDDTDVESGIRGGSIILSRGYSATANTSAGSITFHGRRLTGGYRNGARIAGVGGSDSAAYDRIDLVFYASNVTTNDSVPEFVEAMRIKANADIVAPSFSGESTFKDGIILPNAKSIKVTDTADTPNVMNALYLSSNNNLIIGSGVATQSYNTYIDGYNLRFRTNNNQTLALYIDASGNVGVGTSTTLTSKFTVDGSLTATTVNGYTLAAACAKAVTDSSSASAIGTGTSLPTERDIYYGLPTINNAHNYTSSTTIYAPTGAGTSGYWLKASGGTSAPVWESTANLTAGKATADGDGNTISSTYLKLAGGTMTGDITMTNGEFINAASGYAMLGIGSGGTTFYCGPGNEISSSFLIRSGDIDLTHAKAGTNYTIWDASNSNLSTVSWAANNITAAGSVTASGAGSFDTLTLTSTSAVAHLAFSRGGYNYITAPASGSIGFVPNGLSTGSANSRLLVSDTEVAITKASGAARLAIQGTTANQAAGEILFRARSSSFNGVKIIGVQGATSNSYDRIALEIQAANGTSASNVTWKRAMRVTYGANIIIGASGATSTFTQYGDMTINGSITSTGDQVVSSDATLKTNWRGLNYGVVDIAKATAGVFDWKDGRGSSAGTVAQDWKKLVPELVHGEEGNMTLAYGQIAMLNTILLARTSEDHEERIKALEAENKKLKEEINRLRMN